MDTGAMLWIVLLGFLLFLAIGGIVVLVILLLQKQQQLQPYQPLIDLEREQAQVKAKTEKAKAALDALGQERLRMEAQLGELRGALSDINDALDIQEHGLYEPKYDFASAERYKVEIDRIRKRQREMIKDKVAVTCPTDWTVEGSKRKGRTMINEQIKLMLRAFNGECDALILKVKYNNIASIEKRMNSLFEAINKLGKSKNCWIERTYLNLKLAELYLVHEYEELRQQEKEEQRQIRAQIKEEQRAAREIEQAQKDAEAEEERYQQALDQAREELALARDKQKSKLQAKIDALSQALAAAKAEKERAISRAQMTKSGHVYIISNIGSFGDNIYKIGMTRRLKPWDRVKELGDASVPFPFDVHAMIYTDDAPALESALHQAFDNKRVNLINTRKEFFNVSLAEIAEVVHQNNDQVTFTKLAQAEEYRKSRAMQGSGNDKPVEVALTNPPPESKPPLADKPLSPPTETAKQHLAQALAAVKAKAYSEAATCFGSLHHLFQQHNAPHHKQLEMCAAQAICLSQAGDKTAAQQTWQKAHRLEADQAKLKQIARQVASQYGLAG